ncbi:MAG TPA: hypothetical protein VFK76_02115 [Gaiellaceae bacterium]|nr:hypothetical protein [Gaiellaceae bacterium]
MFGTSRSPRGCARRTSLRARIRDWWDLRLHRYERLFAGLDPLGPDEPLTGAGVREPRRPLRPTLSAGAELDLPDD